MARSYWLVKSEPNKYAWDDLVKDGTTCWDGVRNAQARNNLRAMKQGDPVLYYHSNEGKQVVGVAKVTRSAYQDPTTGDERWLVVDLAPLKPLSEPVTLATLKDVPALANMALVKQSRLSVMPVTPDEFQHILKLGRTKLR